MLVVWKTLGKVEDRSKWVSESIEETGRIGDAGDAGDAEDAEDAEGAEDDEDAMRMMSPLSGLLPSFIHSDWHDV